MWGVTKEASIKLDDQRVRPEGSEVERLCADNSRARELLGWQPRHTLEDGLTRTIEWVKENLERFPVGIYAT